LAPQRVGLLLVGIAWGVPAGSQPPRPEPAASYRVDANLVLIPVTVTDGRNRPITGLTRENFHVYEKGVEQRVLQLYREDTPLAVGFVFDTSQSMAGKLAGARTAAAAVLATANPEDEYFLLEFKDQARIVQPFTEDPRDVRVRLERTSAHGHTALVDAVYRGLDELRRSSRPRKALVIFSDGGDNHSRYTEHELLRALSESDVAVYAVGMFPPAGQFLADEQPGNSRLLAEVTRQTGGRLFAAGDQTRLPEAAATIAAELHNRYIVAYSPGMVDDGGKFHRVQVKVAPLSGARELRVWWRPGYYSPGSGTR
jgi:Ca-activated chloride channel family protein